MKPSNDLDRDQDRLEEEAVEWVIRLTSGETAETERRQAQAWRSQSLAHERAFQSACRLWKGVEPLRETLHPQECSQPTRLSPRSRDGSRLTRRTTVLSGTVAAAVAALVIGAWLSVGTWSVLFADYRTGVGERRSIPLPDGTMVHLNTNTALSLRYSSDSRRVELLTGEADFVVAKDARRPFIVEARRGWTRAVGTEFLVRHHDDDVAVIVVEGTVEVGYAASKSGRPSSVTVQAHQGVAYGVSRGMGNVQSIDPHFATAWRRGTLIFESTPLATVVAEINRYRAGRIILLNDALSSHHVNAVFFLDRLDEAARTIEATLPVRSIHLTNRFILLR